MRYFEVPALVRKTILEELSDLRCVAVLPGTDRSSFCPYTRGGREGGVDTPSIFCLVVEERMDETVRDWNRRGVGFPLRDFDGVPRGYISHAVWADNIYMVADSIEPCGEPISSFINSEKL